MSTQTQNFQRGRVAAVPNAVAFDLEEITPAPKHELLAAAADAIQVAPARPAPSPSVVEILDEALRRLIHYPTIHLEGAGDLTIGAVVSIKELVADARAKLAPL